MRWKPKARLRLFIVNGRQEPKRPTQGYSPRARKAPPDYILRQIVKSCATEWR